MSPALLRYWTELRLEPVDASHKSSWMQTDIFTKRFKHIIDYIKPSEKDPVPLVLHDHYSHTRNMDVMNMAHEIIVSIVCLPQHCKHKIQPLDGPFVAQKLSESGCSTVKSIHYL